MGATDPNQDDVTATPIAPASIYQQAGPAYRGNARDLQTAGQRAIASGQDPKKVRAAVGGGYYDPNATGGQQMAPPVQGPNITAAQAGQFHADPAQAQRAMYGGSPLDFIRESANAQGNANARAGVLSGLGNTAGAQSAQSYGQQQQARGQALDAVSQLRNYYQQGPGPSQAQALLQQGSDAAMAQNLALARSGRGAGGNAEAMRSAMFQNAAQQQQLGQQQSALSAQEAATWRGQQLQAMGQEQSTLGNIRSQDLGAYGQGQNTQGAYANAAAAQGQAGDVLRSNILGQQLGVDQQTNIANAGFGQQAGLANSAFDYQSWAKQNDLAMQKYGIDKGVQMQQSANDQSMINGIVGGIGTVGAAMAPLLLASDERVKRSVRADMFDLRPAQGYSYEYKRPEMPGAAPGRQFGPMAQDLEKTPAGASTVRETPNGKAVDTGRLALVNTGAIADLQQKHDDLAAELERIKRGGR